MLGPRLNLPLYVQFRMVTVWMLLRRAVTYKKELSIPEVQVPRAERAGWAASVDAAPGVIDPD